MTKGTAIKVCDMQLGERYSFSPLLEIQNDFIVVKIDKHGFHLTMPRNTPGLLWLKDKTLVYTNPMTELEKALL